jgi:hypothetical protein
MPIKRTQHLDPKPVSPKTKQIERMLQLSQRIQAADHLLTFDKSSDIDLDLSVEASKSICEEQASKIPRIQALPQLPTRPTQAR